MPLGCGGGRTRNSRDISKQLVGSNLENKKKVIMQILIY
jgi:hypothetical protein